MKKLLIAVIALAVVSLAAGQEAKKPQAPAVQYVRCGALVEPESGKARKNVLITVEGERITEVREGAQAPAGARAIDLSDRTCLPGLIDAHTHVLLQGDITAADYDEQLLKQSVAYRTILDTRSVKRALEYGFSTLRDPETECAGVHDVDWKY